MTVEAFREGESNAQYEPVRSPVLADLITKLQTTPLDWDSLRQLARQTPGYKSGVGSSQRFDAGFFAELHVGSLLSQASGIVDESSPDFPIPENLYTAKYIFRRVNKTNVTWEVYDYTAMNNYVEYDHLALIQGDPTKGEKNTMLVIEVKTGFHKRAFTQGRTDQLLDPIRELQAKKPELNIDGIVYMVVGTPNVIKRPAAIAHIARGGAVALLPISDDQLRDKALQAKRLLPQADLSFLRRR